MAGCPTSISRSDALSIGTGEAQALPPVAAMDNPPRNITKDEACEAPWR